MSRWSTMRYCALRRKSGSKICHGTRSTRGQSISHWTAGDGWDVRISATCPFRCASGRLRRAREQTVRDRVQGFLKAGRRRVQGRPTKHFQRATRQVSQRGKRSSQRTIGTAGRPLCQPSSGRRRVVRALAGARRCAGKRSLFDQITGPARRYVIASTIDIGRIALTLPFDGTRISLMYFSSFNKIRKVRPLPSKPPSPRMEVFNATSPPCPNGGRPMSWTRQFAPASTPLETDDFRSETPFFE